MLCYQQYYTDLSMDNPGKSTKSNAIVRNRIVPVDTKGFWKQT